MDKNDIQLLCESYGKVIPKVELFIEASGMLPSIIKVSEIYEGGPNPGQHNIEYKIITRQGNRVKAMCSTNPDLTCTIDIDGPDVTADDHAYHTTATFKWDDARKTYTALENTAPAPTEPPGEEDAQLIAPGDDMSVG